MVAFLVVVYLCFICQLTTVNAIIFDLEKAENLCLSEEVMDGDMMTGTFKYDTSGKTNDGEIVINIFDDNKSSKFQTRKESGSFALEIRNGGLYDICFWNKGYNTRSVTLQIKHMMKDIEQQKKDVNIEKEKLEPLQKQMQGIYDAAKQINSDFHHLKRREWEMRDVNETTNARVVQWGFLAIVVYAAVSAFQVFYLRQFFSKKKLI